MKDFRKPYKDVGQSNPNSETNYNNSFQVYKPNQGDSSTVSFKNIFIVSAIALAGYFYYSSSTATDSISDTQEREIVSEENAGIFSELVVAIESSIEEFLIFLEEVDAALDENPDSQVSSLSTDAESDSESSELNDGFETTGPLPFKEFSIATRGSTYFIYGILENTTDQILGQIRINAEVVGNSSLSDKYGFTITSYVLPGKTTPFEIIMSGWDGTGELKFSNSISPYHNPNFTMPDIKIGAGTWVAGTYKYSYDLKFENKTKKPIRFPQLILVLRNESGQIEEITRKYIATKEEDYTMKANAKVDVSIESFGRNSVPSNTEVFFSHLP
ncbi:hypothetical protein [Leptospira sp. GIMC2001]|uniref:hypothetical protein n=1 Tax=Leptospira sp. GIMC2001 TaxID=1513297 RepID=UPI0023498F69|nr:hypothetical protein [Leptospira sp. GIMC2001]WCL49324.1 hypothetical protein O4O04_18850 [Leptospira sp. GIMC2001]